MAKQEGQREMSEKCLENFIEGAAKVVKDTDLAMKALGIDEETQEKIRKAREIVHKAHCADLPVPDKIVIRKETEPQPPSFEEAQGESGTNVAEQPPALQPSTDGRGTLNVATAEMLNAANGKSRLGCTVAAKFSRQFSDEVSWQKVDPTAAAAASGEEDITEGGDNQGGNQGGGTTGGELEG